MQLTSYENLTTDKILFQEVEESACSGLNQIALYQCSFCRIRGLTGVNFFLNNFIELIKDKFYNVI